MFGFYHLYMTDRVSFYGTLGYSELSLKTRGGAGLGPDDESGFSYGVGFEAYGFNIEWMQYLDTADVDASVAAIGYNYRF